MINMALLPNFRSLAVRDDRRRSDHQVVNGGCHPRRRRARQAEPGAAGTVSAWSRRPRAESGSGPAG